MGAISILSCFGEIYITNTSIKNSSIRALSINKFREGSINIQNISAENGINNEYSGLAISLVYSNNITINNLICNNLSALQGSCLYIESSSNITLIKGLMNNLLSLKKAGGIYLNRV